MSDDLIIEDFPMSEVEFEKRFNTEQACIDYLAKMKWPDGFYCRHCGHRDCWISAKHLYICTRCETPQSLTSGTVMHGTKKPLRFWFKAMWWFTTRKSGVNAVNLKDLLGFGSYQTAWAWLHKLRSCTIRRNREPLSGRVEVDEFFIGGQKPGKRGRGANGKVIVLAAVEKQVKKFGRIRLQVVQDCSGDVLEQFVCTNVVPGSHVATDGWKGYNFLSQDIYTHHKVIASKTSDKSSVLSTDSEIDGKMIKNIVLLRVLPVALICGYSALLALFR